MPETTKLVVDAVPETVRLVVDAPPTRLDRPMIVEEALEMKPLTKVARPVKADVPTTERLELVVMVPFVVKFPLAVVVELPPIPR